MKTQLVRGFCFAAALTCLASPSISLAAGIPVTGSNAGKFNTPNPTGWIYTSTIQNNGSGAGSSKFTWGTQTGGVGRNWMEYKPTGNPITTNTEAEFKLGTLTYFNGTTVPGTTPTSVGLQIALNLIAPEVISQVFDFRLDLISTTNTSNPIASADYVKFPSTFPGTTITVSGVDYTLEILGFRNAGSNGFVGSASDKEFHVKEGYQATAELWARVTSNLVPTPAVPEPASLVSAATAGLIGLGLLVRRRKVGRA